MKPLDDVITALIAEGRQAATAQQPAERDWIPQAIIGMMEEERCHCGGSQTLFIGFYGLLKHKREQAARRLTLLRSTDMADNPAFYEVPVLKKTFVKTVPACSACVDDFTEGSADSIQAWDLDNMVW